MSKSKVNRAFMVEMPKEVEIGVKDDKFTLVVGEARIPVSKQLLKDKSPIFDAMFESGMFEESTLNEMVISDFSELAVRTFVVCLKKNSSFSEKIYSICPKDLLALGNKYQIMSVMRNAEQNLLSTLTVDNVISIINLADLHSCKNLKEACIELVALNAPTFLMTMNLSEVIGSSLSNEVIHFMHSNLKQTQSLYIKNATATPSLTRIVVSGAGEQAVNGAYIYMGMYSNAGFYSKTCRYNNELRRFYICKELFLDNNQFTWYIFCGHPDVFGTYISESDATMYFADEVLDAFIGSTIPHDQLIWKNGPHNKTTGVLRVQCIRDVA